MACRVDEERDSIFAIRFVTVPAYDLVLFLLFMGCDSFALDCWRALPLDEDPVAAVLPAVDDEEDAWLRFREDRPPRDVILN